VSDSLLRKLFDFKSIVVIIALVFVGATVIALQYGSNAPVFGSEMSSTRSGGVPSSAQKAEFAALITGEGDLRSIPASFFREHYDEFGPHTMLAVLDDNQFCHSEAHNVGRVIYEREQGLAVATNICQNQCSSGCIHGALMGFFTEKTGDEKFVDSEHHATFDDLTPAFRAEIASMCSSTELSAHLILGDCYHALGHALMVLANYDIPAAIELCAIFNEYGVGARYYCATGAYMERDIEYGESDRAVSALYPCDESPYPAACFRYKLRRAIDISKGYSDAVQFCTSMPKALRAGCSHGLGYALWRQITDSPASVNAICGWGTSDEQRLCLEGVFGYTNMYDGSVARKACAAYDPEKSAICKSAARVFNFRMSNDFSVYAP